MSFEPRNNLGSGLYCVTAEAFSGGRDNLAVVEAMIAGGARVIQYREKEKSKREKYLQCLSIRRMTLEAGVTFIVNDDTDLALAVQADGVHIGQDDLPLPKVRELVGEDFIIGLSTHSPGQAREAVRLGADYIGVGPVYQTLTKADVGAPVGLEYVAYVAGQISLPWVAIGGIKLHNLPELMAAGARWACLITEVVAACDIAGRVRQINDMLIAGR